MDDIFRPGCFGEKKVIPIVIYKEDGERRVVGSAQVDENGNITGTVLSLDHKIKPGEISIGE